MNYEMQRDALYPGYAVPVCRVGDVRNSDAGQQAYTGHGWIECDGRTLLTVDYQQLFEVLGYMFGGQGGTFKLPDLRRKGGQGHPESALPSRATTSSQDAINATHKCGKCGILFGGPTCPWCSSQGERVQIGRGK